MAQHKPVFNPCPAPLLSPGPSQDAGSPLLQPLRTTAPARCSCFGPRHSSTALCSGPSIQGVKSGPLWVPGHPPPMALRFPVAVQSPWHRGVPVCSPSPVGTLPRSSPGSAAVLGLRASFTSPSCSPAPSWDAFTFGLSANLPCSCFRHLLAPLLIPAGARALFHSSSPSSSSRPHVPSPASSGCPRGCPWLLGGLHGVCWGTLGGS